VQRLGKKFTYSLTPYIGKYWTKALAASHCIIILRHVHTAALFLTLELRSLETLSISDRGRGPHCVALMPGDGTVQISGAQMPPRPGLSTVVSGLAVVLLVLPLQVRGFPARCRGNRVCPFLSLSSLSLSLSLVLASLSRFPLPLPLSLPLSFSPSLIVLLLLSLSLPLSLSLSHRSLLLFFSPSLHFPFLTPFLPSFLPTCLPPSLPSTFPPSIPCSLPPCSLPPSFFLACARALLAQSFAPLFARVFSLCSLLSCHQLCVFG